MKKIVYALLATVSGLVLLFSYRTSLEVVTPTTAEAGGTTDAPSTSSQSSDDSSATDQSDSSTDTGSGTSTDTGSSGSTDSGTTGSDTSGSSTDTTSTGLADGTYTGASVSTRFGPVQVQITVSGGIIVSADAVDYPTQNGRDRQINQIAVPRLVSETLDAQSANIDMISGATYTSTGYVQSLQSALDEAAA
jgi:uncharacterized protein with FMN-binding domain